MKHVVRFVVTIAVAALLLVGWHIYRSEAGSDITVINQIQKIAKLQTVEVTSATTLKRTKTDWAGAQNNIVYFAEGTVTASIDLEEMSIELNEEQDLVTIRLPDEVEIANPTHDKFKIICEHGTLTAPSFTSEERSLHSDEAFSEIKSSVVGLDIEGMALVQAKEYLTTFVNALGYDVQFT